jgi:DNA-binding beta-propeller fold protein YncE
MVHSRSGRGFRSLLLGSVFLAGCAGPQSQLLTAAGEIALPADPKPTVDLLTVDSRSNRLYVSHKSANSLEVIDTTSQKLATRVPLLGGVSATALSSDPDIVFTSNSAEGTVGVVNVASGRILAAIPVGGAPDAIEYDPVDDLVIVSLGSAKKLAFIDPATRQVAGNLDLPGDPELMAVDPKAGRVFLAIHDKDEVASIDPVKREISLFYRGCDIKAPTGVAFDAEQGRLFVASSALLNVIDTVIDKCLGAFDIGRGTDQIAINPNTHRVYTANGGSGNLSILDTVALKAVGVVGTRPGAGTLAVDPTTGKIYVAEATIPDQAARSMASTMPQASISSACRIG